MTAIVAALRGLWGVIGLVPAQIWAAAFIGAVALGCHERSARQQAETDMTNMHAQVDRDRALAAESALEATANAITEQDAKDRRQQEILDELETKKRTAAAWASAYTDVVRARADDAAGVNRLRRDIAARIAADAARDRAQAGADTAASACARRAAELGDLLEQGVDLAAEGAGLVDQLRARLGAAARIIGNDRALMSRPHSQ